MPARTTLLVFLALLPSAVAAQDWSITSHWAYHDYCTTGGFSACSDLEIRTINSASGTDFLLRWRNGQGSTFGYDNTGGYRLNSLQIDSKEYIPTVDGGLFGSYPTVTAYAAPDGNVQQFGECPYCGDHWRSNSHWWTYFSLYDRYLMGCDGLDLVEGQPSPVGAYGDFTAGYRMCERDGLGGWLTWGFHSDGIFTPDQLNVRLRVSSIDPNRRMHSSCLFHVAESVDGCVAVPEPRIWMLLLTGALALGLVAARRRESTV